MTIFIFFLIFTLLVAVHEFGHYYFAKRSGMEVQEFGFGIPPRIAGWKKNGTLWSINLLPLGGFVRVKGADNVTDNDADTAIKDTENYHSKTWGQRMLFICGGVLMNFLLAILLFSFGYMIGMQPVVGSDLYKENFSIEGGLISEVLPQGTAQGKLIKGDLILNVNGQSFTEKLGLKELLSQNIGKVLNFEILRKAQKIQIQIPVGTDGKIGVQYGLVPKVKTVSLPLFHAFAQGIEDTWNITSMTVIGLLDMVRSFSLAQVQGPVGMVGVVGQVSQFGFAAVLQLTGVLSISLAVLNMLPLPALDGGRALFLLIEGIIQRRIPPKYEMPIHALGFLLLLLLMVLVTIEDIRKLLV